MLPGLQSAPRPLHPPSPALTASTRPGRRVRVEPAGLAWVGLIGVLVLAGLLRWPVQVTSIGDEPRWLQRSVDLGAALRRNRDPLDTYLIGHPGVTVAYVALGGLEVAQVPGLRPGARGTDVTRQPSYQEGLSAARAALITFNLLLLTAILLLLWRLAGPGPALISGVLLATEPFLIAHSQLVHLDASLAGLMAVAVLSALAYWWAGAGTGYLLVASVATALACLTRTSALYLLGFIPLVALVGSLAPGRRGLRSLLQACGALLAWGALAAATALLLWPALRAEPLRTVQRLLSFAGSVGSAGHDNFFLGTPTDDPGWLYYVVALGLRLSVGAVLGLLALAITWRRSSCPGLVSLLLVFALGFGLMLSLGSKKFDRYLLPAMVVADVLAGLGWWTLWRAVRLRAGVRSGWPVVGLLLLAQVATIPLTHPYPLAYYSPLFGGGRAASQLMLVGWGEGLEQAAAYINALPGGERARVAVHDTQRENLQATLDGLVVKRVGGADYAVDYVNTRQRGQVPIPTGQTEVLAEAPLHQIWINGIEYVRIYRLRQQGDAAVDGAAAGAGLPAGHP